MTIKFTDAMIIGSTLKVGHAGFFLQRNGDEICGCATGGAFMAIGVTPEQYNKEADALFDAGYVGHEVIANLSFVRSNWPWLTPGILNNVSSMYSQHKSVEEIVDYLRPMEPPDPAPEPFPVDDEQPEEVRA